MKHTHDQICTSLAVPAVLTIVQWQFTITYHTTNKVPAQLQTCDCQATLVTADDSPPMTSLLPSAPCRSPHDPPDPITDPLS